MTVVAWICAVLLFFSAVAVIIRVSIGPSMLDRMVGVDLLTSTILGAIAVISAVTRRTDLLPVLVVLAIVGFIGSTVIARFLAHEPTADKRVLTKDEVAHILADDRARGDDAHDAGRDENTEDSRAG